MNRQSSPDRIHRKVERSPEEQARLKAARERFQAESLDLSEMLASGRYEEPTTLGAYLELTAALAEMKKSREQAGLSLADVSERSGIDAAAISRLENGHAGNPTVNTLQRYASAIGKRFIWSFADAAAV
jgi:ribosome-binding protein aMBF1 (putative translation factor)